jgi:uncharacterized protein (DUF58 family)
VTTTTDSHLTAAIVGPFVAAAALGALSVLTGSTWLMLLAGAGLGLVAAAVLLRPRLGALTVSMTGPERAAVGEPVMHRLHVHNSGSASSPPLRLTHTLHGLEQHRVYVVGLPPGGSADVDIRRFALHRGVARGCEIRFESSAPLGLLAVTRVTTYQQPFVVHPAVVAPHRSALRHLGLEDAIDPVPGPGLDIAGVREWQHGDDPRRVHWRSTARRGRLIVAERGLGVATALSLAVVGPSAAPDWEGLVARAASTARAAQLEGRQVTVQAWNGHRASPALHGRSVVALLDWWAGLDAVALPWPAALVAAGTGDPKARELLVVASTHVRPSWWQEVYARAGVAGLSVARLDVAGEEVSSATGPNEELPGEGLPSGESAGYRDPARRPGPDPGGAE